MHRLDPYASPSRHLAYLTAAVVAWYGLQVWAATVSTHPFGRYEIIVQEGLPVALGEILGTVRRQSGRPDYPLLLRTQNRALELSILGPGNRPIRLAATPFAGPRGAGSTTLRFIVERALAQDGILTLWVRQANAPRPVSLAVDLHNLERMLEGPR